MGPAQREERNSGCLCNVFFYLLLLNALTTVERTGRTTEQRLSFLFHAAGCGQIALQRSHIVRELPPGLTMFADSKNVVFVVGIGAEVPSHTIAI